MENLKIEKGQRTPAIDFNKTGELLIEGRSTPEDTADFFRPLLAWIKDLKKHKPPKLEVHVKLEFFNTASANILINIFKHIEKLKSEELTPAIFWYYDESDEDSYQAGLDYQSIIRIPFHVVPN